MRLSFILLLLFAPSGEAVEYRLASINYADEAGGLVSRAAGVSADGEYVLLTTVSRLVEDDTNYGIRQTVNYHGVDGYLYDLYMNTVKRITLRQDGSELMQSTVKASLSPDGKAVFFSAEDPDVIPGVITRLREDTIYRIRNVFYSSLDNQSVEWLTVDKENVESTGDRVIALSGSECVYVGHANFSLYDLENNPPREEEFASIYYHNSMDGERKVINQLTDGNTLPYAGVEYFSYDVSHDVRYLAAVSVEETFGIDEPAQIVLMDTETRQFDAVSINAEGDHADGECEKPKISSDGRFVAFQSNATNLIPDASDGVRNRVYVYDQIEQQLQVIPLPEDYPLEASTFSVHSFDMTFDGRYIVYALLSHYIYRYDRETGKSELVFSPQGDFEIEHVDDIHCSGDANVIAFTTDANLSPLDNNYTSEPGTFGNDFDVYVAILEPESLVADWECY